MRRPAIVLLVLLVWLPAAFTATALEQLRVGPKPVFREGHTLIPLTTWGPEFSLEIRRELCENWGYALQFGRIRPDMLARLNDPASVEAKVCALAAENPERYPLHVTIAPAFSIRDFTDQLPAETWCTDENGRLPDGHRIFSPEAPDSTFDMIADYEANMLKQVLALAPVAVITNGGEYGLSTVGHHLKYWEKDPKVVAARGDRDWFEYISERKAHQEMIITERIRELVPDRLTYVYYPTEGCPHRDRYANWWQWTWDYAFMKPVSDLPSSSIYWKHFNSGWSGDNDALTQALNATAQHIAAGQPLSYNWMNPGWPDTGRPNPPMSDAERYMGYLKCYYTAGMIGGVAGYFAYDPVDNWIWQLMCLGHVQALFSHLEQFVRESELLPGPDRHVWSKDLPAYELPTGSNQVRVLARKHRERPEWLLVAWAADGPTQGVSVDVPDLGAVSLSARPSGSVYLARKVAGAVRLVLVDLDGMLPTARMGARPD